VNKATSTRGTSVGSGLLIYDGDCGFCSRTAAWLRRRLPRGYEVQASQRIEDLYAFKLTRREVHEAAYWIDPDGRQHRAHLAIIRALESSRGLLGFVAKLGRIWPFEPVAERLYFVIARNRHRFPGAADHCRI
jgi:predicted DCC family thiol-disulfide oxidoreductase YuxK